MWYLSLPSGWSWDSLWYGYTRCSCGGIRKDGEVCGACKEPLKPPAEMLLTGPDGRKYPVQQAVPGGEDRYEDYVYLRMLEREWLRPISDEDRFLGIIEQHRPSARAIVVLVFWTYFETKIARLIRSACRRMPERLVEDFLRRNQNISKRLNDSYRVLFDSDYWGDLKLLGYSDVAELLQKVHEHRNQFAHGHPEAINDELVENLVGGLQREHEGWIAVFNKRVNCLEDRDA